jgi:hypothetical protein
MLLLMAMSVVRSVEHTATDLTGTPLGDPLATHAVFEIRRPSPPFDGMDAQLTTADPDGQAATDAQSFPEHSVPQMIPYEAVGASHTA